MGCMQVPIRRAFSPNHLRCPKTAASMQAARTLSRSRLQNAAAAPQQPRQVQQAARARVAATRKAVVARIAAVDQPAAAYEQVPVAAVNAMQPPVHADEDDQALVHELELEELDAVQEQMIQWMAMEEEQQEEDLDEMVDYDEFGDEEYAEELFDEVDNMIEASNVELKIGDKVVGTVYEIDEDGAYVEVGHKYSGFVPLSECSFARLKTPLEVLRVGMKREFMVVEDEDEYDQVILSLAAQEASIFWHRMRQLQDENLTVYVKVESANRGGLLVKYGPYDGFIPVSQFGPQINPDTMDSLVGSELPAKFLEVDEDQERLVFSNRRAAAAASGNLQGFKVGDVVEGVVQSLRLYGAFLDLGNGNLGLLHVSQISHEHIVGVDKILREGDRLKVMVLSMDPQRGRVVLSTKKLEPNPGDMLRNPQLVYEKAEEMADMFRKRIGAAEMNARVQSEMAYSGTGEMAAAGDF